jgi:acyl-CoA synthetase (AMP-forming)/AMP-acid ligase II
MDRLQTLTDVLRASAAKFPAKVAAIDGDRAITYGELADSAARLAGGLTRGYRLEPGDRVAIASPTCLEYLIAYWGLQWAGLVPVPVNIRLAEEGVAHVVGHTESALVLEHPHIPAEAARGLEASGIVRVEFGGPRWGELLGSAPEEPARRAPDDLAIIMHTSGTTGLPKGAMMTHGTSLFNIRMAVLSWGWRHEDVHLLVIPLFHCTAAYSAMPSSVYLGSTLVLLAAPDPGSILDAIEAHCVTTFLGVPSLFHLVASRRDLAEREVGSLRMVGYSGSPMSTATIRKLRQAFPGASLHNFFGLTETISNTHVTADRDADERPDSIGKPLPEVFQRILLEDGAEAAPGEVGELCLARENVIPGYWRDQERLEDAVSDGWFHTGDLAAVDDQGYTYLRGRKKDMIIVAGENVYALEVERGLVQHPKVLEAAVVGVPATGAAAYMGEIVKAVVVPEEGSGLEIKELRRFCIERLASYQVPQKIELRAELPRTPSGKVIKRLLVEE